MRQSLQSVQKFSAHLSINIVAETDKDSHFSTMNLVNLATILMFIWHIQLILNRVRFEVLMLKTMSETMLKTMSEIIFIGLKPEWGIG